MPRRAAQIIIIAAVIVIAAGAPWAWRLYETRQQEPQGKMELQMTREEMACIDRVVSHPVPEGGNAAAMMEECRAKSAEALGR